jgi:hypothetical protein
MTSTIPTKKLIGSPLGLVHPATRRKSHVYEREPPRHPAGTEDFARLYWLFCPAC